MNNTESDKPGSLKRMVRRFVVQERCADKTDDWYDDPDIRESVTLEDARKRLEKDLSKSRGHDAAYLHRVIERTEQVVKSPNRKGHRPGPRRTRNETRA